MHCRVRKRFSESYANKATRSKAYVDAVDAQGAVHVVGAQLLPLSVPHKLDALLDDFAQPVLHIGRHGGGDVVPEVRNAGSLGKYLSPFPGLLSKSAACWACATGFNSAGIMAVP